MKRPELAGSGLIETPPTRALMDHSKNDRPKKHKDETDSQKLNFPNHGLLHASFGKAILHQAKKIRKPESTLDS